MPSVRVSRLLMVITVAPVGSPPFHWTTGIYAAVKSPVQREPADMACSSN